MMSVIRGDNEPLSKSVRLPEHVVIRDFADDAVALNLKTGQYHGLNRVAARMVEVVVAGEVAANAVPELAAEFGQEPDVIEGDLITLLDDLTERGLVEIGEQG